MNDVWENMKDANGNSYVYAFKNNLGSHASDVSIKIEEKSRPTSDQSNAATKWTINKFAGGNLWGWSKLAEAERGASVDCSGYDAAVFEINNTTGQSLYLNPRYGYFNESGAAVDSLTGQQYALVGEDGSVSVTTDYQIPADFKGKAYMFFKYFENDFVSNLSRVRNDFRMVIGIDDNNNGKTFELSNYRFTKTGVEQYKQDLINSLDIQRAKYDDSNYSVTGVLKLDEILTNGKQELNDCNEVENVGGIYNNAVKAMKNVNT